MDKIRIERLNEQQRKALNIPDSPRHQGPWSVWECAPSIRLSLEDSILEEAGIVPIGTQFDRHYDQLEKAHLYEGKVKVKTPSQEVDIKAGDFVVFPKGLSCSWQVLEKVRKVYKFE